MVRELQRGGLRDLDWHFLVAEDVAAMLAGKEGDVRITSVPRASLARRLAWEQLVLPWRYARHRGEVLLSAANYAPVLRRKRTVLLTRNALHFGDWRFSAWQRQGDLESGLARLSVRRSRLTITATDTMSAAVQRRTSRRPLTIYFGPGLARTLGDRREDTRYCFTHRTLWGPHKRLPDMLRAIREVAGTHRGRFIVSSACDPYTAFAKTYSESELDRALLDDPLISEHIEFASFDPRDGARLDADAVIVPSTIESFCFPLAEAVALGIPVVAAESSFARELCGASAVYAQPGDPGSLADGMRRLIDGDRPEPAPRDLRDRLSWARHVDRLAAACRYVAIHDRAPDSV